MRQLLPQRRPAETVTVVHQGRPFTVTIGFYADGRLGEVFVDVGRIGQDIESIARDAGVVLSIAIQHGAPIETIRHAVTRDSSGAAASILGAIVDRVNKTFPEDFR